MDNPGILLSLFAFLVVISVLVFVHEMGHYLVGRWCGVKVETFAIGFGKEIAGWTDKRGTRWKIGILPLGGYCQFAGDMDPASTPSDEWLALPAEERDQAFQSKSLWRRTAIVFAGPAINFLFAILILIGFATIYGESIRPAVALEVDPNSAAQQMGMKKGDVITSVAGRNIDTFDEMVQQVVIRPREEVIIEVLRDGGEFELTGVLGSRFEQDRFGNKYELGRIGLPWPPKTMKDVGLAQAPSVAVEQTIGIVDMIGTTLGQVISGRRSIKDLGGPLKIAQVSGEQFAQGLSAFIFFVALISINLGFINLLPIPMLDGGHLVFYAFEAIRRKPANPKAMEWAFRSGFALVIMFMIVVTFNDLSSFGLFKVFSG